MPYSKITFQNEPSVSTPVSAENLNHMQTQYDRAVEDVSATNSVYNIMSYGAIGDGVADDSAAINNAIAAAEGNASVVIPPGDYAIGSRIILKPGTRLVGYGATIHRKAGLGTMMANWIPGDTTTASYNGPSNITVEGLTLDAHGDTQTANPANMLGFGHCKNVRIVAVTFLRCSGYHSLELNAVDGAYVEGCRFLGFAEVVGLTEKEAIQIDCAAPGDYGAADNTPAKNVTIIGCEFSGYNSTIAHHTAVGSHNSAGGFYDNIRVIGCTINAPTVRGINAHWWRGSLIDGNTVTVENGAVQGIRVVSADAVTVSGNRVSVNTGVTHTTQGISLTTNTLNSRMIGNHVDRANEGFYIGPGADNCVVEGNTTYRTSGPGVTVNGGDDALVLGNFFNAAGYTAGTTGAIRVTGTALRATVMGNKIRPHGAGTEVTSAVSVNTGSDAFVFGNDIDPGLDISGGGGTINTTRAYRDSSDRQLLTDRRTGWAAPTGTATRTTFATGTVTTAQLAERVKALIDDLTTHGLIGS